MTSTVRPEMEAQVAQIGAVLDRRLDEPTQDTGGANMRPHLAAPTPRRGDAD
jgi:hypothetical protein